MGDKPKQRIDGTHIFFDFLKPSKSGKTLEYHVRAKDDCLGTVNWFGRWRCYSFNPCREPYSRRFVCGRDRRFL